jgi:hypothetical protein
MNPENRQPEAFVEAEIVCPRTLGRPIIKPTVVTATSLEELDAKMTRGQDLALGRGVHVNFGARYVRDPKTGKYKPIDAVSAAVRGALIGLGRVVEDLTIYNGY